MRVPPTFLGRAADPAFAVRHRARSRRRPARAVHPPQRAGAQSGDGRRLCPVRRQPDRPERLSSRCSTSSVRIRAARRRRSAGLFGTTGARGYCAIPDGVYEAEDFVDDNGFTEEPLRVAVRVTIDGDTRRDRFRGELAADQGHHQLAARLDHLVGLWRVRHLLGGGSIPVNDGLYRPIRASTCPMAGSSTRANLWPCAPATTPCHRIYNVHHAAMSDVVPDRVLASVMTRPMRSAWGNVTGPYRVYMEVVGGGWGASGGGRGRCRGRLCRQLLERAGREPGNGLSLHADRGVRCVAARPEPGASRRDRCTARLPDPR